jgi:hypothetical protein
MRRFWVSIHGLDKREGRNSPSQLRRGLRCGDLYAQVILPYLGKPKESGSSVC